MNNNVEWLSIRNDQYAKKPFEIPKLYVPAFNIAKLTLQKMIPDGPKFVKDEEIENELYKYQEIWNVTTVSSEERILVDDFLADCVLY